MSDSSGPDPKRRQFLRLAATAGAASIAGCNALSRDSPNTDAPPDDPETEQPPVTPAPLENIDDVDPSAFSEVVNVEELGNVADAARSITPLLADAVGDDTLVYLPPGRYLMDEVWNLANFENVAVIGDAATIVPPAGYSDNLFAPGPSDASGFRLEGVTFDFRRASTGARVLHAKVADGLAVRDVTVRGRQDVDETLFRVDVTSPDGVGVVERLRLPDGATANTEASGCLVGDTNQGRVRFLDCEMRGFPDNGLYAAPKNGYVEIFGGTYANNGISNVRVRGDSHVRGVTIVCDRAPAGFKNMRGLRIREGSNVLVEDCTVEIRDLTYSDGAIELASWAVGATIRNTSVHTDANGVVGLRAKSQKAPPGDAGVTIENCTFTGSADDGAAIHLSERQGVRLQGVCIRQNGANRDGIVLEDSRGIRIADAYVDVPGQAIRTETSQYVTSNIQTSGSLPSFC